MSVRQRGGRVGHRVGLAQRRRVGRGFTVVELLAVIAIMAIVLAVAVPALSNMLYSSNRSLAENSVRAAILVARDLAAGSLSGGDAAVMFEFEPGGVMRLVPAEEVGSFTDVRLALEPLDDAATVSGSGSGATADAALVERDVFVATGAVPASELPRGWMVRGAATAGSMLPGAAPAAVTGQPSAQKEGYVDWEWYKWPSATGSGAVPGGYGGSELASSASPNIRARAEENWLFPESGFFDDQKAVVDLTQERGRSSFMVRFRGGTGELVTGGEASLFVSPGVASGRRLVETSVVGRDPFNAAGNTGAQAFGWQAIGNATGQGYDLRAWARRVMAQEEWDGDGVPGQLGDLRNRAGWNLSPATAPTPVGTSPNPGAYGRSDLIGARSNDMVLVQGVSRLAIYEEPRLAAGIGARGLNRVTGTIYQPYTIPGPQVDAALFGGTLPTNLRQRINWWIAGDTTSARTAATTPDGLGEADVPEASIFTVLPLGEQLAEVTR